MVNLELGEESAAGIEVVPDDRGFEALEELRDLYELRIHLLRLLWCSSPTSPFVFCLVCPRKPDSLFALLVAEDRISF